MDNKLRDRIYSFDIMRIIAACAVIMIHISADYVITLDGNTWDFLLANFFNSFSRFAVPMFVMISGALMLDENKAVSSSKILQIIWNMLFILFSWSFFYAISFNLIKPVLFHEEISVASAITTFFYGHYHMWYLYVQIGLYAVTPLLRFFVKKENATLIRYYLILAVIICFTIPFANHILNHFLYEKDALASFVNKFKLECFYEYLIYYVLGWYITHVGIQKKYHKFLYLAGITGLAITIIGTQIHSYMGNSNYFFENNSINVFVYSVALFTWIHSLFQTKKASLNQTWIKLSNYTFGVYLIHCCYLFIFNRITKAFHCVPIEIIVTFLCAAILCFLTVSIIAKIPFLKKFIRC